MVPSALQCTMFSITMMWCGQSCLQTVRKELHDHLTRINPDKNWDFIINQVTVETEPFFDLKARLLWKCTTLSCRSLSSGC